MKFDDVICFGEHNCAECAIITRICSSFLVQFGNRRDKCFVSGGTGDKSLVILTILVQLAPM